MTDVRGSAREWRLYVVAVVAGVYVLAWSRITPKPQQAAPAPALRAVWLDELPQARRPQVTPPAGWQIAERGEAMAPIPRRIPAGQVPRIRTRSS